VTDTACTLGDYGEGMYCTNTDAAHRARYHPPILSKHDAEVARLIAENERLNARLLQLSEEAQTGGNAAIEARQALDAERAKVQAVRDICQNERYWLPGQAMLLVSDVLAAIGDGDDT
jgi:hypothetical protein